MMLAGNLWIIITLCIFLHYLWTRRKYYILSWKMNSKLGLPFIGVLFKVKNPENILNYITVTRAKFTPRNGIVWFGPRAFVYISEPATMKKILTSTNFLNKLELYTIFGKHVGDGLISSKTPTWNHHRKQLEPSFGMNILKSFLPIFNAETEILNEHFKKYVGIGEIDIMPLFQYCTLDITFQTTMGKRMHFQTNPNSEMIECVINLFNTATARMLNPFLWSDFVFGFMKMKKIRDKYKLFLENYVTELMTKKLSQKSDYDEFEKVIKKDNIFLDRAMGLWKLNQFSESEVISESNVIIASSFDTTANSLSYAVMLLAMFPEYQDKVYEELVTVFPEKENIEIIYEDLSKLVYLEKVINESMRIIAPVPLIGRTAKDDFELENGILLPKNTQIIMDIFNMHRDERVWGPTSKTFNPDHFSPEFKNSGQYECAFMPFAQGSRPCIGGRYAMISVKTVLAKVLRRFRFTTKYDFNKLIFMENVTMKLCETPKLEIFERPK